MLLSAWPVPAIGAPAPADIWQTEPRQAVTGQVKIGRVWPRNVVEDRMSSARISNTGRLRAGRFDVASIRAIPIRSVAVDLGFHLTATGTGRCRLPGHADRNPSFAIRPVTNRFTCYACNGKGDVIDLAMVMMGLDFVEACKWLADRYLGGASRRPLASGPSKQSLATRPVAAARTEAPPVISGDCEVFEWLLGCSPLASTGDAYLRSRVFTEATIQHFRIGQVSDRSQILREALGRFGRERLRKCGIIDDGRFGERLVFPTGYLLFPFMIEGEVAYLQARRPDQETKWRWLCPRGLLPPVFNQDVLSGDASTISICEGVTDVISAHELGLVAIGLVGVNGHLDARTLARLRGRNVAVYGDVDDAGSRFSRHLVRLLSAKGITAIPKRLPEGVNDLNDQLRRMGGSR
jgi:DNA primase